MSSESLRIRLNDATCMLVFVQRARGFAVFQIVAITSRSNLSSTSNSFLHYTYISYFDFFFSYFCSAVFLFVLHLSSVCPKLSLLPFAVGRHTITYELVLKLSVNSTKKRYSKNESRSFLASL
jgi:hypothetical protein